jgi:hypothetical protein
MRPHMTAFGSLAVFVFVLSPYIATAMPAVTPYASSFLELKQIKKFVSVEVQIQGTAEKLGLKSDELTDTTRVMFLKSFPGVSLEIVKSPPSNGTERLSQLGFLTCEVWTVGEEYIVAYHMDCNAGSYVMPGMPGSLWNRAILGYGPKGEISEAIHNGLRSMIEQFAITFFKVRGDSTLR